MSERRDLLVEIGTEELPPKALKKLSDAFTRGMIEGLAKAGIEHGAAHSYATPRRLAILLQQVVTAQPARTMERRGPALNAAFDEEGNPSRAALGFAQSCGVSIDDLQRVETDKGAWLVHRFMQQGAATASLLPAIIEQSLNALPTPKRMRWGSSRAEFVRPVHWMVVMLGEDVVDVNLFGVRAGRETRGHRFHHAGSLYLGEAAAYAPLLETEGRVMPSFPARREAVRAQVLEAAQQQGGTAVIDEDLLDEVTALVEWPVAVVGGFEERFLDVPPECLIATMKGNQKYFHLVDAAGKLLPRFITIANIDSKNPDAVRAGNERVVRPRLADAMFFWEQDRKRSLESRREQLRNVVFQAKLGTVYDKTQRVSRLAEKIAFSIGGDAALAARAASLAKSDLMSEMVGEFPELQGVMGRYYALAEGLPAELAESLDEQYMPRFAGDALPRTTTGRALAIADRIDTLVGIFAAGQTPTGDKDPFGLRRAALGVLRILIECELPLDLEAMLGDAAEGYANVPSARDVVMPVFEFVMERLRAYYAEQGLAPDAFEAVFACRPTQPLDFDRRVRAVYAFRALPEAESLTAANKRLRNILRQAQEKGYAIGAGVDASRCIEPAEKALAAELARISQQVTPLFDGRDYAAALTRLAQLRESVDAFFDTVMVLTDDAELRSNRLALLRGLHQLFLRAADLSRLQ